MRASRAKKGGMRVAGPGVFTETQRLRIHPKPFLKYFLPKGHDLTRKNMQKVVKHFHLAFKGMETDEIYDVLMEQLIAAIDGYDPCYKAKVKKVVEVINRELAKRKQFRVIDVRRRLEFDCDKHLRLLCRRGFLDVVPAGEGERERAFNAAIGRRPWSSPREMEMSSGWRTTYRSGFDSASRTGSASDRGNWNPKRASTAWKTGTLPAPTMHLKMATKREETTIPLLSKWFQPTAIIETIVGRLFPPMSE